MRKVLRVQFTLPMLVLSRAASISSSTKKGAGWKLITKKKINCEQNFWSCKNDPRCMVILVKYENKFPNHLSQTFRAICQQINRKHINVLHFQRTLY